MRGLEEAREPRPTATRCGCAKPALETGNLLTEPIGYLESCFSAKNGTPRQPSICSQSRACLRIRKSIFNNPEHSLMGLEQFSHVWILFVFHKNGHLSYKAKVQPPRLNGAKTGVFSTRSPHRPNAIGLTLATLEKVEGGAVYLTGIDMIHGTPVLDIKPYIADYDSPQNLMKPLGSFNLQNNKPRTTSQSDDRTDSCDQELFLGTEEKLKCLEDRASEENSLKPSDNTETPCSSPGCRDRTAGLELESRSNESVGMAELQLGPQVPKNFPEPRSVEGTMILQCNGAETEPAASCPARTADRVPGSVVPTWVKEAPAPPLQVRFTPHAEMDLEQLSSGSRAHSRLRMKEAAGCEEVEMVMPARRSQFPRSRTQTDAGQVSFKYFQSTEEAKCAIKAVLAADPRSVYRRKLCQDRLFYFSVDIVHVTCWFGDGFAEVLRVKLASEPVQMTDPKQSLVTLGS